VLKARLRSILNTFDHSDLNLVLDPLGINPSSENIARYIYEKLEKELADWAGKVSRVEVYETPGSCAAYYK
jgi:6-pyruvoyltetrahydropterin/6-carboxytetrahydropterin synthase